MLCPKKTKLNRLMIFSVTAMFMLTAIQFSIASSDIITENISIKPRCTFQKIENFQAQKTQKNINTALHQTTGILNTDTLIYDGVDTEIVQNPTILDDSGQNIMIGFEIWPDWLSYPDPYFRYSNDGGTTWLPENDATGWALADQDYQHILPTVDFAGDRGGFGSALPYDQNNWVTLEFPDIGDPESPDGEWIANSWLADVMMSEWHSVDACGVNSIYAPTEFARGFAVWTGDTIEDIDNGIWFGWDVDGGSTFVVYPDEGTTGFDFDADQAINDVDLSTGKYYQGFYRFNDESTEHYPDGVFLRSVQLIKDSDEWVDSWTTLVQIPGAAHPDLKAVSGNCYMVYELNGGIGCAYSNDNGVTFDTINVIESGTHPCVSVVGDNVIVAYYTNGNIYNSISDDKGKTWTQSPASINDIDQSVKDLLRCVDGSGTYLTWTDTRNGENSVYFDTAGIAAPIITIDSITGGLGVTATIKNIGSLEATDLEWSISFDGGTFFGGDNSGTITTLAIGETVEIKSKFLLGFGSTTITINVGGTTETKDAKVFLFFVIGL
jgi:hypothetical protein